MAGGDHAPTHQRRVDLLAQSVRRPVASDREINAVPGITAFLTPGDPSSLR
jgi:hypothetical protein